MTVLGIVLPIFTALIGAIAGAAIRPAVEDYLEKRKRSLTIYTLAPFSDVNESLFPADVREMGLDHAETFVHKYAITNRTRRIIKGARIRVVDATSDDTKIVAFIGYHENVVSRGECGRYSKGDVGVEIVHFEPKAMVDFVIYSTSPKPPKIFGDGDLNLIWPPFAYGYVYGYGYGYPYIS